MGPKLAQQTPARLISCVWVPWCVCLCAHITLSLYHTFEVILVDGFCDVALPHFEIKDSSKICRFFLFLMCLYGCMSVVRVHRSFISKMLSVLFCFVLCLVFFLCVWNFFYQRRRQKNTFAVITVPLRSYTEKSSNNASIYKGIKTVHGLFTKILIVFKGPVNSLRSLNAISKGFRSFVLSQSVPSMHCQTEIKLHVFSQRGGQVIGKRMNERK